MGVQIISFNCTLRSRAGHFISSTVNRDVITDVQGETKMLGGLAQGLQNLIAGEKRKICLSAQEAYGFYDPRKVILYPRENVTSKKTLRCGDKISVDFAPGQTQVFRIIEILSDTLRLDSNHPLAGQDLVFEIEALSARDATQEEISESRAPDDGAVLH